MADTAFYRGEGGVVWEFDLPLRPAHQAAVEKGQLIRVNEDGSTFQDTSGDVSGPEASTAKKAAKAPQKRASAS
jgi:hypothetical protein